jgi:hypothetical protein
MNHNSNKAGRVPAAVKAARRFAAQAEAAIADLEVRVPTGMDPLEQALAERIRAALARMLDCAKQLAADGLIVEGSTGRPRPHQLLKTEQDLRREIGDGLQTLVFRAEQGAMIKRANARTRKGGDES